MKRYTPIAILAIVLFMGAMLVGPVFAFSSPSQPEAVLSPGEAFAVALSDMRQVRGLTFSDTAELQALAPLSLLSTLEQNPAPTRSQLTLLINGITHDGQPIQEISQIRPGFNITAYNHGSFRYVESELSIMGMPFPLANIGVDGSVISARVPLLYDRYFTVDMAPIREEAQRVPVHPHGLPMAASAPFLFNPLGPQIAAYNVATEILANAINMEPLLLELMVGLLDVAHIEVDGYMFNVVIPAAEATAALGTIWDGFINIIAASDFTAVGSNFHNDFIESLPEMREVLGEIHFAADVALSYTIIDGVLFEVTFEGVLGFDTSPDEARIMVTYINASGDHLGDVIWIIEVEDIASANGVRFFHSSNLDTTNGYDRNDRFRIYFSDRWSDFVLDFGWQLFRTPDGRFNAGMDYTFREMSDTRNDNIGLYVLAQGRKVTGDDYLTFDLERLTFGVSSGEDVVFEIVLRAFYRREVVDAAAVPRIAASDKFHVMDASREDFENVWLQVEENIEGLTAIMSLLGMQR